MPIHRPQANKQPWAIIDPPAKCISMAFHQQANIGQLVYAYWGLFQKESTIVNKTIFRTYSVVPGLRAPKIANMSANMIRHCPRTKLYFSTKWLTKLAID